MISKRVNDERFSKRLENLYWKRNPSWDLEFKKFDDEKFKEVDGYYGFYFISNYGQVISFYNKTPYVRKFVFDNGYYYIILRFLRVSQYYLVHELVYSHFIAPIEQGKKVIHRNGITTDNYYKNLQLVLTSTKRKQYRRKLLDFSLYNRMQYETVNRTVRTVPVLQFDKNGKFIKEFPSLTAAAMSSCSSTSQIARCCSLEKCTGAGFQWRYKDDPIFKDGIIDIDPVPNPDLLSKREILQFDLDGNFIKQYASIMDACRNTGAAHDKICACLKKNSKSTHGYQWRYKNDPIFKNRITNIDPVIYSYKDKAEPVLQFNLKGDLLREFASIAEASKLTGIFYDNIIKCLKRKSKTAEGYQWFFKKDLKNKKKVSPVEVRVKSKKRQTRTVLQFDLDGSYIKEYPSSRGAALELNISYSSLKYCLSKKTKSAGGFQWKYKDDPLFENGINKIDPIARKINKNSQPVLKFDLNGNFLHEYPSLHEAGRKAGVSPSKIIKCAKGELKSLGGFIWRKKEKSNVHQKEKIKKVQPLQREQKNHPRPVLQFDLEGNFINRFSSIVEAAGGVGASSVIINCLKGFSTTAYGYQWRYESDVISKNGSHGTMKIPGVKYPEKPLSKPILQFSINGKFIMEYSSAGNAAKKTGIPKSCISRCLIKRSKTAGGFQWRYKKDPYFDKGIVDIQPVKRVITKKAVVQFDLKGTFINEYSSIAKAAAITGIFISSIYSCAGKIAKTAGGYQWRYRDDDDIEFYKSKMKIMAVKRDIVYKAVLQFDLKGKYIAEYPSAAKASEITGIHIPAIRSCLGKKSKTSGGFQWRYRDDEKFVNGIVDIEPVKKVETGKPVIQFDLKGHFIAEYPSAVKASEITGIGKSAIRECLYKRTVTSGNFIWLFKNDPILDKQGQPGKSVKDIQVMDTDKRRCG